MSTNNPDDPWMPSPASPEEPAEAALEVESIEGVEPLDAQFGIHPPKSVPDALAVPLFGQSEPTDAEVAHYGDKPVPPLNTYAILDAAKVVNFVEMLEASGLEHRCLFKGEAAQEMRDVAPYVVRLEDGNDFTRKLFSKDPEQDVPWFMWDKEPGIYVRSRGSLEDMWKHFRKFTKVQDEGGKWYYFRFWEGKALEFILAISTTLAAQIFNTPELLSVITRANNKFTKIRAHSIDSRPVKPFLLTEQILIMLDSEIQKRSLQNDIQYVLTCLNIKDTEETQRMSAHLDNDRNWLIAKGFSEQDMLRKLLIVCAKTGGVHNLPSIDREILSDERTGPSARLWLLEKNMKED